MRKIFVQLLLATVVLFFIMVGIRSARVKETKEFQYTIVTDLRSGDTYKIKTERTVYK